MRDFAHRVLQAIRTPLLALAAVALGYLAWVGLDGSIAGFAHQRLPVLESGALGDRVLIVSPHPDDESLAAGGLVRQSLEEHRQVRVVVVTCGDGFRRIVKRYAAPTGTVSPFLRLGRVRAAEATQALATLGLPPDDVVFLGYPDGGLAQLWEGSWQASQPAHAVNGRAAVPYPFALHPGAPYDGSSVASDLASVVASFSPSAVVFPDGDDGNPDHWAVSAFVEFALDDVGYRGARFTYLVHRGHFPFPWSYLPNDWVTPPRTLASSGPRWLTYTLSKDAEAEKERALRAYRSQRSAMEPFLAAFIRRNELFGGWRRPALTRLRKPPSIDSSAMPGVVLRDPAADTVMRIIDSDADLREVALVRTPDALWLGLRTQTRISSGVGYRLSMRLFHPSGKVGRLDVDVRGGRAIPDTLAAVGTPVPTWLPMEARRDKLWVRIPPDVLGDANVAMLGAESFSGGLLIDRTAWRSVSLR